MMDFLHVLFVGLAGLGGGLAIGYRNARDIALGKGRETAPRGGPSDPSARAIPIPYSKQREELTR